MAETEVESILREIRERVLAEQRASRDGAATLPAVTNFGTGESDLSPRGARPDDSDALAEEKFSLISSYLTTTARAWDRLPPLVSNRSGVIGRLELWLKRHLKRGTRWYSWEQVNFNAAVHYALRDLLPLLSEHEHELGRLRARVAEGEARLAATLPELRAEIEGQLPELHAELEAQRRANDDRFAEMTIDMRARDECVQDEQRVSVKQLALETGEAAVAEERARRQTEALLEEVQRRLADIEKK